MSFKKQLRELKQKANDRQSRYREVYLARPESVAFFRALLFRHRFYLLWALALVGVQVLEVVLLRFLYFIYLPPISLSILRILSSVSIVGLLTAWGFRSFFWGDPDGSFAREHERCALARRIVNVLFAVGSLISVLLAGSLLLFSGVHLSSPPIFRAVLLAGIVSLPAVLSLSFLFYSFPSLTKYPITFKFRRWFFLGIALSLAALCFDQPLLYLLFRIVPDYGILFFLRRALLKASATQIRTGSIERWRKWFFEHSLPTMALYVGFEASFYLVLDPLAAADERLPLLIYIAHKLLHIITLLIFKSGMVFHPPLFTADRMRLPILRGETRARFVSATFLFLLVVPLFLPMLLLKDFAMSGYLPTGEELSLSPFIILLALALAAARGVFAGVIALLRADSFQKGAVWYSTAFLLVYGSTVSISVPALFGFLSPLQLLGWVTLLDVILHLALSVLLVFWCSGGPVSRHPHSLEALVYDEPEERTLLFLRFAKEAVTRSEIPEWVRHRIPSEVGVREWYLVGWRSVLCACTDQNAFKLLNRHPVSAGLDGLRSSSHSSDRIAQLEQIFGSGWSEKLAAEALEFSGEVREWRDETESKNLLPSLPKEMSSGWIPALQRAGVRVFEASEFGKAESEAGEEGRVLRKYLFQLARWGPLYHGHLRFKPFRGMFHLNEGGQLRFIVSLPVEKRAGLSRALLKVFQYNLNDALRTGRERREASHS